MDSIITQINFLSQYAVPIFMLLILSYGMIKRLKVYEEFVVGAKDGFKVAVKIIPYLVAILVAISMFRASGALEFFMGLASPVTSWLGFPEDLIPLALIRPLSGSGARGVLADLMKLHGPDSFIGITGSAMMGSTDTTFYVLAVYFGSVGIRKTRYAVLVGLTGDIIGLTMAFLICRMMF